MSRIMRPVVREVERPAARSQGSMLMACTVSLAVILTGPTIMALLGVAAGVGAIVIVVIGAWALHVIVGGVTARGRGTPGWSVRLSLLGLAVALLLVARLPPVPHGIEGVGEDLGWVAAYAAIALRFALDGPGRTSIADCMGRSLARLIPAGPPLPAGPRRQVTLIAYHYPPHTEIGAARPHRFARHLRYAGWGVQVVTSSTDLRRANDQRAIELEHSTEQPLPIRVPTSDKPGPQYRSRVLQLFEKFILPYEDRLGWLPHALRAGTRTMTADSVIISTHPPVVTHVAALILKLRTGRPWIADFRDPLWGNPCRVALRATWFDPLIERAVILCADAVIANTDGSAALLRARYPRQAHAITAIYNGFDPDDVIVPVPPPARAMRTLSHVGTLYGARSPALVLDSLDRLVRAGRMGDGAWQFRQIGRAVPGIMPPVAPGDGVYQSPRHLPQSAARQEMLAADVLLLLLDLSDHNPGLQVPAKLYEYVRTGRPIVAVTPPGSATSQVLAIAAVQHVCIDPAAPHPAFDDILAEFLAAPHPTTAPSPGFLRMFDIGHQIRDLVAVLDQVTAPPLAHPAPLGHSVFDRRHQCAD